MVSRHQLDPSDERQDISAVTACSDQITDQDVTDDDEHAASYADEDNSFDGLIFGDPHLSFYTFE